MTKKFLSVIIPCFNEERRLSKNLDQKISYLKSQDYNWEIILVNDGSSDNTNNIIKNIIFTYKQYEIKLVDIKKNKGKGNAVKEGMLKAEGECRLFADVDNSTNINQLEKLLTFIGKYDIIIASRYINGAKINIKQTILRRLVSRTGNLFIRLMLGLNYQDTQCGFKLFSKKAAEEIFSRSLVKRWGFDIEVLVLAQKLKYKIREVPIIWNDKGDSKLNPLKAAFQVFGEVIKIRQNFWKNRYNCQRRK